jgi:hypothetical protein
MDINNINEAISVFTNSAIGNAELFGGENNKLANKYYKSMKKSFDFLIDNNSINKLIPLLNYSNFGVQLWTASFLSEAYPDKVKSVLERLIEMKIRYISLNAEYTLKELNDDE